MDQAQDQSEQQEEVRNEESVKPKEVTEQPVVQTQEVRGKSDQNKVLYVLLSLIVVILLALTAGVFVLAKRIGGTSASPVQATAATGATKPQGYTTDVNRGTLISQGAYKISGKSFEKYGFKVTIDAVQFTGTDAKVYLTIKNDDTHSVEFMANETASLTDQNGNISNARPFQGENQFNGTIPVNGVSTGWIDFDPVMSSAKMLTLNIPHVFDMSHPDYTVSIPFTVPGK